MEGKAYVGTGEHKGKTFGDFYTFEPEKGWSTFTSLGSSFMGGTAFVAEGNAYVCLGGSPSGIYPSLNYDLFIGMYKLSPGSSVWEQSLPMDGEGGSFS